MTGFDERFGIKTTVKEEREKFVNRVEDLVYRTIEAYEHKIYAEFFRYLCIFEGVSYYTIQEQWNPVNPRNIPPIKVLTKKNFISTLKILTYILSYEYFSVSMKTSVTNAIESFLSSAPLNLGIEFKDGEFYPTGEKKLDSELIDFALDSLKNYPEQNKRLKNALKHYSAMELESTLSECYLTMEGLTREILGNKNRLDDNKDPLLKFLGFSQEWKVILVGYIKFIHEYGRHASEKQKEIKNNEVESCLYLTCLLIRAIVQGLPK
jgi:hypothetical protein